MLRYSGYNCPKCDEYSVQFDSLSELRQHLAERHVTSPTCQVYTTIPQRPSVGLNFQPAVSETRLMTSELVRSSLQIDLRRTTADEQLQSVLTQIWRQVNRANKTSTQAREQHKTELVRLKNDVKSRKTELTSAEQMIEKLTAECDQLSSNCSRLAYQLNEQKQTAENLQQQLEEQNNVITQKDE
jgi:hypothetical protein